MSNKNSEGQIGRGTLKYAALEVISPQSLRIFIFCCLMTEERLSRDVIEYDCLRHKTPFFSGDVEVFLQQIHGGEQLVGSAELLRNVGECAEGRDRRHFQHVRQGELTDAVFGVLVEDGV